MLQLHVQRQFDWIESNEGCRNSGIPHVLYPFCQQRLWLQLAYSGANKISFTHDSFLVYDLLSISEQASLHLQKITGFFVDGVYNKR